MLSASKHPKNILFIFEKGSTAPERSAPVRARKQNNSNTAQLINLQMEAKPTEIPPHLNQQPHHRSVTRSILLNMASTELKYNYHLSAHVGNIFKAAFQRYTWRQGTCTSEVYSNIKSIYFWILWSYKYIFLIIRIKKILGDLSNILATTATLTCTVE